MRVLHIGDIVGKPGRRIIRQKLPDFREVEGIDFVIANAENSAGGTGLTPENYRELCKHGVDCITLGDHIYRRREIIEVLDAKENIVKPANYPRSAPGKDWTIVTARTGAKVAVVSVQGRVFMRPVDCPWEAMDRVLGEIPNDVRLIFVDFHAEATSDMQLMGRFLDGRVTSVLGTHTHVPTADEQIFPGGTAFQCDIGMTGPYESILGRQINRVMKTTRTFTPHHFDVATEDVRIMATLVDADPETGKATAIRRVCIRDD